VNSKVSYPDNEYGKVDWEYPKHENEDRMGVVIEIVIGLRFLQSC
jgi:hypothetical protein